MNNQNNIRANKINLNNWTLFDKVMYGGLGYGSFCLPNNFFKVIIAVIFPPLGEVVNIVGNDVSYDMPFLNWKVFSNLVKFENLNKIIYSFLLTTLFYIPGLVYTLRNISDTDNPL
jgi:uncharacterized membrane protein YqaE (UPF0057 family)